MASSNPYIGPRSFEQNESIYGRDRELRQLTDRLIAERIVLLHAPSGAGKTSLIQAGLIPRMRDEGFFVYPVIRVNLEQPAELLKVGDAPPDARQFNRYIFSTLLSLEEQYGPKARMKPARLARTTLQNYLAYRSIEDQREGPELMIFDQFEEILTIDPVDRETKKAFFSRLSTVLKNRNRWALFVMRSDYIGALEPYARNVPTYFANTFHLDLLGVKSALEAIQKPAQKQGVSFTDAAAQKLVDDLRRVQTQLLDGTVETQLGNHIEPVQLQVVCYRIWEGKAEQDLDVSEADLANVGDVNHSLAEFYATSVARVAGETGISERSIREWFNASLITPDGVRSQARLGVETCEGLPVEVVRKLENTHLIRGDKRTGQTWVELTHDRLIGPVRSDNQKWFDANLSLFQRQAALWAEQGFLEGLLFHDKELDAAEEEAKSLNLTEDETAFLNACRTLRKREKRDRRQSRFILIGFVLSLFFLVLTFIGFFNAETERQNADAQSLNAVLQSVKAQNAAATAERAQVEVQIASTQAISQQLTAQAEILDGISQKATAESARFAAVESQATAVSAAATALFNANEQTELAQANNLVARSIVLRQRSPQLSALLALEAFKLADISATRTQLLSFIPSQLAIPGSYNSQATTTYIDFSLDQTYLVHSSYTAYSRFDVNSNLGGVIKAREIGTGRQIGETFGLTGLLDSVAFSPDGTLIASASCIPTNSSNIHCGTETLSLWDPKTQLEIKKIILAEDFPHNQGNVLLAFSPDGQTLATAIRGSTITIWDIPACLQGGDQPCQAKYQFTQAYKPIKLIFVQNSNLLAFVNEQQTIFLDIAQGKILYTIPSEIVDTISSIALSPNWQYLAVGTTHGEIFLWDWKTAMKIGLPLNYLGKADVTSLQFSPDSKILAAGYADFALNLWDINSHQLLTPTFYRHTGVVLDIAFNSDGTRMASAGDAILQWDTNPASWVVKVCALAGRNLTENEWIQYFPNQLYRPTCPNFTL